VNGISLELVVIGALSLVGMTYLIVSVERFKRSVTGKGEPREIGPQPLVVTPAQRFATVDDCKSRHVTIDARVTRVETRLDNLEGKLSQTEHRIIQAGDDRAKALHRRLNAMLAGQNRILGKLDMPGISEDSGAL